MVKAKANLEAIIRERVLCNANYIIQTGSTIRQTAVKFGVSKTTVHKDITERLKIMNNELYLEVQRAIMKNKMERHFRGGKTTKERYFSN